LIDWSKANPMKASAGITVGDNRLTTALFQKETGARFTLVPYRGGLAAIQDMVGGQIDLFFGSAFQLSFVRAGSIKAYAVTGATRLTVAPDIPTFAEMGLPVLSNSTWMGLFAPLRAHRRTLSANLMGRRWTRWPIRRCALGSPISGMVSFHTSY
jgi:tripartite-type tricarboxylate transporter receptor subunit TctC